ncbi:GATA zinc finger domain-containing protein 7 [Halyomorpha halys]|uniref:GATA zinc finger domain-containing protein 7 n=1 Tax=Halyomorpha halys TaxID=286706 RepID=UPI0006D4D7AD|nr:putative mediator of RNA polymerase II transcription subunit 26 [Halyomorpha halys]
MAKPERHPWPYGPQWNYYPPHMLNFSKIPFSNGPQVNIDPNENYLSIRCPEPRRPYQVPYSSFTSYYHQENHPVRSYLEANPVYSPKQYLYRPLCQENINSPYKVAENLQSYPACSNYPLTKDQGTCYQTTWNNTSHFQRNPPELDVRHFLATWQDKDDDFVDVSTDNDQTQVYQGNDSIPLDCSKRNSNDKSNRKSYNDNFLNGPPLNATGYIVQPYYLKDDSIPLNRPVISEELNNNVLHRNNLNYENNHQSYQKNFYSNTIKFPTGKLLPCEHNASYSQPLNHCDINSSHLRSSMNPPRQKDLLVDSSERSQYNLTSSLESGELFCDINPRHEEIQKPPVIHPMYNDNLHKMNTSEEPCYFGNENNEFSENLMLSDFAPLKDSWDMFSSNLKVKDNTKVSNSSKSVNKVSPQNLYEHLISNNNNNNNSASGNDNNNINLNNNLTPIAYEGAFNILPNISSGNQSSTPHNSNECVLQSHEVIKPNVSSQSHISTKLPTNITKPIQANTKIRPFQFNEEISSDDIDISIASSGDFLVEEDQPSLCCNSVISFSKVKKEKINTVQQKVLKNNDSYKVEEPYSCPAFNNDSSKNSSLSNVEGEQNNKLNGFPKDTEFKSMETEKKACSPENAISSAKGVMDLTVLKPQNIKDNISEIERDSMCYLDISNNYFETSNFERKTPELRGIPQVETGVLGISHEKCDIQNPKDEISDILEKSDKSSVQESNFSTLNDALSHIASPNKLLDNSNSTIPNDNLLLLAHCSQEYGSQIKKENDSSDDCSLAVKNITSSESQQKTIRDSVIKCSLRWDRIFNIMSDEVNSQPDMSLDLGPAKVELRLPSDNCSSNHWKIVEADNKIQTSSIVKVKRLILKRKNQPEERIPKMIIKKTEGQEYRSYLKNESSKAVLHCEKLKIYCDKLSKSPQKPSDT